MRVSCSRQTTCSSCSYACERRSAPLWPNNDRCFFLNGLVPAGKSVESVIATVLRAGSKLSSKGLSKCALIARNLIKSSLSRKRCNIFASGKDFLFGRKAKSLHAPIFAEQPYQQVEGMSRSQKSQQQHAKQLGGRIKTMPTLSSSGRKQATDKGIIQVGT